MMNRAAGEWVAPLLLAVPFAFSHCGAPEDERTGTARQAIIEGGLADERDAPVLLLYGPGGQCSACLVAPNLVATARHCIANTREGGFSCTSSGELVLTVEGYGSIGVDHPPSTLKFYDARRQSDPKLLTQAPDAYGAKILSTGTASACRDDLAFVVLDRPLLPTPLAMRLTPTAAGEGVSLFGFGVTENIKDPTRLRVRNDAVLLGVGPDVATDLTQPAPVRAVRTSPVSCVGDSGGAIVSNSTGELVAVISLGTASGGPYCSNSGFDATVGPRLGAYPDLVDAALSAARATLPPDGSVDASDLDTGSPASDASADSTDSSPERDVLAEDVANVLEDASTTDAASTEDASAPDDAAAPADEGAAPGVDASADANRPEIEGYHLSGGGCDCAIGSHRLRILRGADPWWAAFGWLLIAARGRAARRSARRGHERVPRL